MNRAASCGPGSFSVWLGHSVKGLSLPSLAALALDLSPHWQPGKQTLKVGPDLVGKVWKVSTTDQAF